MSQLPHGWQAIPLKELITLNKKFKDLDDDLDCGFVPMANIPTKLNHQLTFEPRKWRDCKKGYTHFQNGDVLLAKITPCFENGKSAFVNNLPNGVGAGSTEYFVMRPKRIDPRYLHAFLKTKEFVDNCTVNMSGSVGHKRVPKDYLLNYFVPVAPQNDQKRIADKLDSVLAKVEAAQARLDKIPTILKRFRQSVLTAATSGELTKGFRKDTLENRDHDSTWKIRDVPASWSVRLLPEVADSRLGKMLDKNKNSGVATKYLGNVNLRWHKFDLENLKEILVSQKEINELNILDGDLLLCEGGEPGRGAVWRHGKNSLVFQKAIHRIRCSNELNPEFLLLCVEDDYFSRRLSLLYTGTTIKHLTGKALKKYPVKVPPFNEQREIVRRVNILMDHSEIVEKQYVIAKARLDKLTQSILAKAFRGDLVKADEKKCN